MAEQLANNASGTLNAAITNVATSFALGAGQGAAFPSTGNFRILIDSELMLVGARATDTLSSITRGIEGTANVSHLINAPVTHIITQAGLLAYIQDNSVQKPSGVISGEAAVWNGTTWVRSSATPITESGIKPGANGQYLSTVAGVSAWTTPPVIAPTFLPCVESNATSVANLGANVAHLIPVANVVIATTISRLSFYISTVSGNMDLGIYYSDDETTFTRLFSTGSFAVGGALNNKAITQQTITPVVGRRWFYAVAFDNGSATMGIVSNSGGGYSFLAAPGYQKAASFVLPSSLTGMSASATYRPVINGSI